MYLRSYSIAFTKIHPCQYSHSGGRATELFELFVLWSYSFCLPSEFHFEYRLFSSFALHSSEPHTSLEIFLHCCDSRALRDSTHPFPFILAEEIIGNKIGKN